MRKYFSKLGHLLIMLLLSSNALVKISRGIWLDGKDPLIDQQDLHIVSLDISFGYTKSQKFLIRSQQLWGDYVKELGGGIWLIIIEFFVQIEL